MKLLPVMHRNVFFNRLDRFWETNHSISYDPFSYLMYLLDPVLSLKTSRKVEFQERQFAFKERCSMNSRCGPHETDDLEWVNNFKSQSFDNACILIASGARHPGDKF
jgi:hypothetical protein